MNEKNTEEKFNKLVGIMETLRAEGGCPWDRKQTFESLRAYIVEEAYELVDAITRGNVDDMCEESGDLLLQIVFVATIAKELKKFDIGDVIDGLCDKLIRRHPHVFGSETAETSEDVLKSWEQIKLKEKEGKRGGNEKKSSVLAGVPEGLPALVKAYRIQEKAAHVGFDWDNSSPVVDKVEEELREVRDAVVNNDSANQEEEIGDLLFATVNLARHIGVNPDVALGRANAKFMSRFKHVESSVERSGREWRDFSLNELDNFWNEAKQHAAGQQ